MKLNPNGETTNNPTSLSEAVITREDCAVKPRWKEAGYGI